MYATWKSQFFIKRFAICFNNSMSTVSWSLVFVCTKSFVISKINLFEVFHHFFFCCMFILSRTCMYNTKSLISYHVTFACRYALFWVDARHSRQEVWKGQPKVGLILFFFKKFKYCVCKYNCWIFYYKLNCSYKY